MTQVSKDSKSSGPVTVFTWERCRVRRFDGLSIVPMVWAPFDHGDGQWSPEYIAGLAGGPAQRLHAEGFPVCLFLYSFGVHRKDIPDLCSGSPESHLRFGLPTDRHRELAWRFFRRWASFGIPTAQIVMDEEWNWGRWSFPDTSICTFIDRCQADDSLRMRLPAMLQRVDSRRLLARAADADAKYVVEWNRFAERECARALRECVTGAAREVGFKCPITNYGWGRRTRAARDINGWMLPAADTSLDQRASAPVLYVNVDGQRFNGDINAAADGAIDELRSFSGPVMPWISNPGYIGDAAIKRGQVNTDYGPWSRVVREAFKVTREFVYWNVHETPDERAYALKFFRECAGA